MSKIDHIGIAVNSLSSAIPLYTALLGENPSGVETVPEEQVRVAFFGETPPRIELLEPTEPGSSLARVLVRRGPGVHHVCVNVPSLPRAVERARDAGLRVVPPAIRRGAAGRNVCFLHPGSTGGVLIELCELSEADPAGS